MKLIDRIRKAFKKFKKRVIVYETELTPELARKMPEILLKELAKERARADRLEEKVKKLEEKVKKFRKLVAEKEMEEAYYIEKQIREERRRRTKFFRFKSKILILSLDKLSPFKDSSGKEYPYWAGTYVRKIGGEEYKGIIVRNDKGEESMLPSVPRNMFEMLFPETFLEDCLRGRLVINMTSDGEFVTPYMQPVEVNPKEWTAEMKQRYLSVRDIIKRADEDTKKLILSLMHELNDAWQKVREAEERSATLLAQKLESDLTSTTAMRITESVVPSMAVLADKIENIAGQLAPLRIKEQEAFVRFAGAEKMAGTAWEVTEALINKLKTLSQKLEIDERKRLVEEMRDILTSLIKKKEVEEGGKGE